MKMKEFLIWQKMLYNRGGAWLSDGVLGGIVGASILRNDWLPVIAMMVGRWLAGVIDWKLEIIHVENELAIRRQNPYLDKRLGNKRRQKH